MLWQKKKKIEEKCQQDIELTDKKIQDLETVKDEQEILKKELESLINEDEAHAFEDQWRTKIARV